MTKRRPTTADLGGRSEAEYAALADWAEHELPSLAPGTFADARHGEGSRAEARALIAAYLPDNPADDSPAEAFARAEIARANRGPGRPSLTSPGVPSTVRQVRLPGALDARLALFVAAEHTSRSAVMRTALEQYLERQPA